MNQCKESIKPISARGKSFFFVMLIVLIILNLIAFYKFVNMDSSDKMYESVKLVYDNSSLNTDLSIKKTIHSETGFIVFIICDSILIAITLILFYLTEQSYNDHICKWNKANLIYREITSSKNKIISDSILSQTENTKKNEKILIESKKEFYPQSKASIDLFKAYSNAIADL